MTGSDGASHHLEMLFVGLCVACFLAAFTLDAIEAYYVRSVGDTRPHRAALYSVAMYIIGCVGFFSVLSYSWWLMLPELAGLYCGSVYAVRRQAREKAAAEEQEKAARRVVIVSA